MTITSSEYIMSSYNAQLFSDIFIGVERKGIRNPLSIVKYIKYFL